MLGVEKNANLKSNLHKKLKTNHKIWLKWVFVYRIRKRIDKLALFVGAERGKIDQIAVILFPCLFVAFSTIYWIYYLHMAARKEIY